MRHVLSHGLILASVVALGCGGTKFAPVSGELVYPDGSPVTGAENGAVVFEATDEDGRGYGASGTIGPDGKFQMTTETPGDGALIGKNRVLIAPLQAAGDAPPVRVLDPKYEKFDTSGLTFDVAPGQNEARFVVEPVRKAR